MIDQARLGRELRWQRRGQWSLAVVALVLLTTYSVHVLVGLEGPAADASITLMAGSWVVFAVDYVARLWLADNRRHWFLQHLLDLGAVLLPVLQPLRLVGLVTRISLVREAVGSAIHGRVMVYTVTGSVLLIYVASLAELQAERHAAHATINSFGNALWWSITTITTVGYGNIYPITDAGRAIAAALMIGGMSLVGMITATIASWIVHRVSEEGGPSRANAIADIAQLRGEIQALRRQLGGSADDPAG